MVLVNMDSFKDSVPSILLANVEKNEAGDLHD